MYIQERLPANKLIRSVISIGEREETILWSVVGKDVVIIMYNQS